MDDIFQKKKSVTIFATTPESPLRATDLLTYCYRAYQDHFGSIPKNRRVAKATGLREKTVADSTGRLQELGLLDGSKEVVKPVPRLEYFRVLESLRERFPNGPETLWFQNWKCLVRQPGTENPMKMGSVLVYSLLRHSCLNKWKPPGGWTKEYLATATGLNTKTVTSSIQILEQHGFIEVLEGFRFRLFRLSEGQMSCFADKSVATPSSADPDEICNEVAPASSELDKLYSAKTKLTAHVEQWYFPSAVKQAIVIKTMSQTNWIEKWPQIVDYYITKQMERDTGQ